MFARYRALPRTQRLLGRYTGACSSTLHRAFSTTELSNGIRLAYDLHEPPTDSESGRPSTAANKVSPIIFIHGLFGSKKNNRSMSKYAMQPRSSRVRHLMKKAESSPAS